VVISICHYSVHTHACKSYSLEEEYRRMSISYNHIVYNKRFVMNKKRALILTVMMIHMWPLIDVGGGKSPLEARGERGIT